LSSASTTPLNACSSIRARRFHQRKQFVDSLLRHLSHAIGIFHAGDVDALYHRFDLVAKVGEESQGIALFIGDTGDQAGEQNLIGEHAPVQFFHDMFPIDVRRMLRGDMNDARGAANRDAPESRQYDLESF
jgi:hypothetical protein